MSRYHVESEDRWIQPVRRGYKMMCCDCGLCHVLDFRIKNGRVQFRAFRNNRSTAMARRMGRRDCVLVKR